MTEAKTETAHPIAMMVLTGIGRVLERLTQPQFLLALLSTAMLWWLTRELIGGKVPEAMREVVSVLVGFITGQMVGPGWQFYFGTTKASAEQATALAYNAKTLRAAGMDPGGPQTDPKKPVDVNVVNPYDAKTDDELRQILGERAKDTPEDVALMDRPTMLARLAELDAVQPPGSNEVMP